MNHIKTLLKAIFVTFIAFLSACDSASNDPGKANQDTLNTIKSTSRSTNCLGGGGETLYVLQNNKFSAIGTAYCNSNDVSFSFSDGSVVSAVTNETLVDSSTVHMNQIASASWTTDRIDNFEESVAVDEGQVYYFKTSKNYTNGSLEFTASGAFQITKEVNPDVNGEFILKIEYKFFEIKSN